MPRAGVRDDLGETPGPQQQPTTTSVTISPPTAAAPYPVETPARDWSIEPPKPTGGETGLADIQIGLAHKPVRTGKASWNLEPHLGPPSPKPIAAGTKTTMKPTSRSSYAATPDPVDTLERGWSVGLPEPASASTGLAEIEIGQASKFVRKGRAIRGSKSVNITPSPHTFVAGTKSGAEPTSATSRATISHPAIPPAQGPSNHAPEPTGTATGLVDIQIGQVHKPVRKGRASPDAEPNRRQPSPDPIVSGTIVPSELTAVTSRDTISWLVELNKMRRASIKGQQYCDRSIESLISSFLTEIMPGDTETIRKARFSKAKQIRVTVEKGNPFPKDVNVAGHVRNMLERMIVKSAGNRTVWDPERLQAEKQMADFAKELPVYQWQQGIPGFGELGLAILVAEAAGREFITPAQYRTVSGLWKRMGLAVIDGERQRRVPGKRKNDEERIKLAYVPERRSACWVLSDSLLKKQVCSELRACRDAIMASPKALGACQKRGLDIKEVDDIKVLRSLVDEFDLSAERHATGRYGEVYMRRKAHTFQRVVQAADLDKDSPLKWTLSRCHNDAMRVMFKALLKDLWIEWRKADRSYQPHS